MKKVSDSTLLPWELPRFSNWVSAWRANQTIRKSLGEALLEIDLDMPSYDVLAATFRYPGMTQSDLADLLVVGRSNLSMLLPDLEQRGWLKRLPDENDKRVRLVYLTEQGEMQAKAGLKLQVKLVEHLMEAVTETECEAIGKSMRKITDYLKQHPFEP